MDDALPAPAFTVLLRNSQPWLSGFVSQMNVPPLLS